MPRPICPALLFSTAAMCALAQDAATTAAATDPAATDPAATNSAPVVRVTAARLTRTLPDVAGFVSVLERNSAEMGSAFTVDQAAARLAGADHQSHGLPGASAKLDFRGLTQDFGSKSTLFIMDGRRMNDPFQGNVEVSHLNPRNVESMTVLRGPASYLYGSGAMGGLVELKMRRGLDLEPFAEAGAAAGNLRTFTASAAAGGQFGETDLYAGATWFKTGGYRPYAGVPKVDWENQDYFANLGWRPSEWDELRLQGGVYAGQGFDREGDRDADRWHAQFAWTREWATPRKQTTTLRLNHAQDDSRYHIAPAGGALSLNLAGNPATNPFFPYEYLPLDYARKYHLRSTGADITHQAELNDRVSVAFGADARHEAALLRDYDSRKHPGENSLGLFGESDIKLADNLTLTLGMRLDKTESFKTEPSPRAALLWRATPDTELYASATKAFRTPGLSDRYIDTVSIYYPGSPLAVALPYKGNPNLKPSSLIAYETGFRQRLENNGGILRRAEFALALFYNDIKDDFDFHRTVTEHGTLQMQVENASRAHTCGVEAEFRAHFAHGLEFLGHASYTEGRYDKSGIAPDAFNDDIRHNRLANLAPWKLGAGLQWRSGQAVQPWRGFDMSHGLFARFTDARYTGSDNTDKLRANTVFDWSSRVQINRNFGLSLTIANVFNQAYNVYDIISPSGYPAPGRVWMIGMDGTF